MYRWSRFILILLCGILSSSSAEARSGLKDVLGRYFLIGRSLNHHQSAGRDERATRIVDRHFNVVVAENIMKPGPLEPREGEFDFRAADELVAYTRQHGLALTGHCLIWHSQIPDWFFRDGEGPASRELLTERIRRHVTAVVTHFKGKVKGWDVVNEAIEWDGSYRRSPFYNILGEDFIEIAFRAAHEADPDVELYYNDYSMDIPAKRQAVCRVVRRLKERGVRIDGVGMQSHVGLVYPRLNDYEASIDSFAACGVKVMITELDVNVLPNPDQFGGAAIDQSYEYRQKWNPYTEGLPAEVEKQLEERWLSLFEVYYRHRHQISRVNLWGIADHHSWLNGWPIPGRTNYPLLFDREYREKPVVKKIIALFRGQ